MDWMTQCTSLGNFFSWISGWKRSGSSTNCKCALKVVVSCQSVLFWQQQPNGEHNTIQDSTVSMHLFIVFKTHMLSTHKHPSPIETPSIWTPLLPPHPFHWEIKRASSLLPPFSPSPRHQNNQIWPIGIRNIQTYGWSSSINANNVLTFSAQLFPHLQCLRIWIISASWWPLEVDYLKKNLQQAFYWTLVWWKPP